MRGTAIRDPQRHRALAFIAVAQLFALSSWFSASAVAPTLQDLWGLGDGELTALTLTVQFGFVVGALGLAMAGIPDRFNSRHIFVVTGLIAATATAAFVWASGEPRWLAFALRALTCAALAGVYPSGLKVMAGWFREGRGMALGVLVGALTVGSASPWLIRGLGVEWEVVMLAASLLTVAAVAMMGVLVGDGPHETPTTRFSWGLAGRVVGNRGWRLATAGYLGHMWELYAMWSWTATFLSASALASGSADGWVDTATFVVIAVGGLGAWLAGLVADRIGRTVVAGAAMAVSGACAALTPLVFGAPPVITVALFVVWGFAVVADSAQFSAMVTETSTDVERGTALTLQTAVGFLLTLITIRGVPLLADAWGWQWAFPVLALGPIVGVMAMVRLKSLPEAARIAGGRG